MTAKTVRKLGSAALVAALLAAPATAGATLVYATGDGIFVAADDGSAPRALSDDGEAPSISPDGRYVSWTQDGRIRVGAADGGALRRTLPRGFAPPQERQGWTGRDELLADHRDRAHRLVTFAFDPATGARRRIAAGALTFSATASPDGSRLVVERGNDLGGRRPAPHALTILGGARATTVAHGARPIWGPAGIAYVKPSGELEVVTPAGRAIAHVTRGNAVVWPVAWLDDGRLLAATAREYPWLGTPGTRALLVDTAAGTVTTLPGVYSGVLGIRPDGSALLALEGNDHPISVALADGRRSALFDGTVDGLGWSR